ncbi:Protein phosphatase PTC7 fig [Erysiphe necator]|nr:Protein phosphatase PTC7 fig [Erysiphe necator]
MASFLQNHQRLIILRGRNKKAFTQLISATSYYLKIRSSSYTSKEAFRQLHTSIATSLQSCETAIQHRSNFSYNIAASYVAKRNKFDSNHDFYDFKLDSKDDSYQKSLTRQQHQRLYVDDRLGTGQDAFFVSKIGKSQDIVMGIADGVGGWADSGVDPADFSHGICHYMKYVASTYEKENWNGSDLHARSLMRYGYNELCHDQFVTAGGSTACVAVARNNGTLEVANLGDSGYVLLRSNHVHSHSIPQTHSFNTPFQLSIVPREIILQTSLFGSAHFQDAPEMANITENNLMHGDVLIIGSDGLWDNLFYSDILKIVSQAMLRAQAWEFSSSSGFNVGKNLTAKVQNYPEEVNRQTRPQSLHRTIAINITSEAKAASINKTRDGPFSREVKKKLPNMYFRGGKTDDICVIVAIVCEVGKS